MKKFVLFFLILIFCPLFFSGCGTKEEISSYNIDLVFYEENYVIEGKEEVKFVNNYDNSFKELCFHLYPNAFREDAKNRVVSLANHILAYPNGESYGGIEIESVSSGENTLDYEIGGEDKNILSVSLKEELFPNESVSLSIDFVVQIPNIHHRFGYGENTINIANFYPILCVYEEGKGFVTDLYVSNGDPFYSEVANYEVSISYNDDFVLASTGEVIHSTKRDGKTYDIISANCVRDFAIVLSSKFEKISKSVNGTQVNYFFYNDENAEEMLAFASECMAFYGEKFGEYPYSQVSVVLSNFVYGGMEYPNLVLISDTLSKEMTEYVIAHELAHQWWYGVVGNNQYEEAWVDEGLTEYSTLLFFENHDKYGFGYDTMITNANSSFKFFYNIYKSVCKEVDTSMARNLSEFDTEPEYIHSVYTQGVIMYSSLRELIGEKKIYSCMQKYYDKKAYQNASGAELISIFSSASGRNLENFFESFLSGKVLIN